MSVLDAFQSFWSVYPARLGLKARKQEALTAWLKLKPDDDQLLQIMQGLTRYKKVCGDYPVDAVRFLRHKRWEDEIVELPPDRPVEELRVEAMVDRTTEYIAGLKRAASTPMPADMKGMFRRV